MEIVIEGIIYIIGIILFIGYILNLFKTVKFFFLLTKKLSFVIQNITIIDILRPFGITIPILGGIIGWL